MQTGYESDDLIAQYVLTAPEDSDEVMLIVSSDKDFYQLLSPNCSMYNVKTSEFYLYQDFLTAYSGLNPVLWADIKAIAGCPSDNIPGLPNVGEKRALKLLLNDGYMVSGHTFQIKSSQTVGLNAIENQDIIQRNYKLTLLPFEGTIDIRSKIVDNEFSMKQFLRICRKYEFQSFRKEEKRKEIRELMSNI
jgi:5'-3' exonuclease